MSKHIFPTSAAARQAVRIAAAGAVLLVLSACGNKGPLVMPQKPVPVEVQPVAPPATETPAEAAEPQDGAVKPVGDDGKP